MPFAWIVIVILWAVVSAINKSSRQKKAGQQNGPQAAPAKAAPARKPQAAPKKADEDGWEGRGMPASPELKPAAPAQHIAKPLEAHMHTPVMGVEGEGTEGIDCCHEYMLDERPEEQPADVLLLQDKADGRQAKALLQGVIFSEILGRRPVKRYGRKSA